MSSREQVKRGLVSSTNARESINPTQIKILAVDGKPVTSRDEFSDLRRAENARRNVVTLTVERQGRADRHVWMQLDAPEN